MHGGVCLQKRKWTVPSLSALVPTRDRFVPSVDADRENSLLNDVLYPVERGKMVHLMGWFYRA